MTTHAYSPHTGELIQTETIAPWMSTTDIDPPQFDAATQSAFFRDGAWVVKTTSPLEDAKAAKRTEITAACLTAIAAGFTYDGHAYDSDDQSRQNIIGTAAAVANGVALPTGFTWRTADNQDVPMDGPGVIALGAALLAHTQAQYSTSWALKAQIDAAQDNTTVEQITWPA